MAKRLTLPADTYSVRMYAYCGMSYDVATGLDRAGAVRAIVRLARRRRKSGHGVSHTIGRSGLPEYEFSEPADCALIPDTAGTAAVIQDRIPAWECFECGDILPIGTACTCSEPIDDSEAYDDETDN